jgi:4-hydroxythreonine-4-phosphate dehydrogenase
MPTIGLIMGDAGGIGPELVVKLLSQPQILERCRPVVVGDAAVLSEHARRLGSSITFVPAARIEDTVIERGSGSVAVIEPAGEGIRRIHWGEVDPVAGGLAGRCLEKAFELAAAGAFDGVVWAPINKQALHLAGYQHRDELEFLTELTGASDVRLYGVLGELWTTCVTLHVPFREVAQLITPDSVLEAILALDRALSGAGVDPRSVAVAALNPHAGDGGVLGREEIDSIGPAVAEASATGIDARGPYPADTVFPRALAEGLGGVVCMYHDQANIARKLQGPRDGATVITGLPVPCGTTAHGTAFDRAGQGAADPGSLECAIRHVAALAVAGGVEVGPR